jgi:hypothetical protein
MRKYLPIALGLAIFVVIPALAKTIHHSAMQSTQTLHMSANPPSQGATTPLWIAGRRHKSAYAPDLDCVQHSFGIDIALAC